MYVIPLQRVANQSFSVVLDGVDYRIELRTIQDFVFMSCWANGEVLFYNQLCTPNNWVNVYDYISVNGKFYFKCLNRNYPTYKEFGVSQTLLFFTPAEVEVVNNEKA